MHDFVHQKSGSRHIAGVFEYGDTEKKDQDVRQKDKDASHACSIARRVAPNLGLPRAECETVEWLVRYHLLMSDMAQKRDIADPRTVHGFAKAVKDVKRLDLLTVLTVCDIRGVGPGVWNNWKAQMIRALYRATATMWCCATAHQIHPIAAR